MAVQRNGNPCAITVLQIHLHPEAGSLEAVCVVQAGYGERMPVAEWGADHSATKPYAVLRYSWSTPAA